MGSRHGDRVAGYVHSLDGFFHNDSGNLHLNGEALLLSRLAGRAEVVFDVGANRGNWTSQALDLLPGATIHSFEPVHDTFGYLARSVEGSGRVRLNEVALSDRTATLRMWADSRDGQMSSATAPPGEDGKEIVVECITGDEYMSRHGINHVDFVKIDVEGHEMEVLHGFSGAFAAGSLGLVQFEFTLWAAIARRWLADYYEFFGDHGFQVGKLWPRGVRWKDYSAEDEQFYRCNFVAAPRGSEMARLVAGT